LDVNDHPQPGSAGGYIPNECALSMWLFDARQQSNLHICVLCGTLGCVVFVPNRKLGVGNCGSTYLGT
jgi:hypothetical protein